MLTEATWLMWIECSCRPSHCGLNWMTLVGVTATWVGKMRLPRERRLATNTSPGWNRRFFARLTAATSAASAASAATT